MRRWLVQSRRRGNVATRFNQRRELVQQVGLDRRTQRDRLNHIKEGCDERAGQTHAQAGGIHHHTARRPLLDVGEQARGRACCPAFLPHRAR